VVAEITSNELCILFESGLVTTGVHSRHDRLPDQGNVFHPGILPLWWRACICNKSVLRRCSWQGDIRRLWNHPVRTQHRPVDCVWRKSFQELEVLAMFEEDGEATLCEHVARIYGLTAPVRIDLLP
jgi:hypothetical protein